MSTPQAFWQTLLGATSMLSEVTSGTMELLSSCFTDVRPEQTALGQTINIPVPANLAGTHNNLISGDPVFDDYSVTTVPIVFNKHPQKGQVIRTWEQFNSPVAIKEVLLDPMIKCVAQAANGYVASLCTSGNFSVNPVIATTGGAVTPDQFVFGGFNTLLAQGVDVRNKDNMAFVQANSVYTKQLRNAEWAQESLVGKDVAEQAKVDGGIRVAYGAKQLVDQQMPVSGTAPNQTFTSIYKSRAAIAVAFRPIPAGDPNVVKTTYVYVNGIPIRIEFGYQQLKGGWCLNVDAGMGCAVTRPEQAVLFSTAQ